MPRSSDSMEVFELREMLRRVLDCGAMQEDANDDETKALYDEAEALLERTS